MSEIDYTDLDPTAYSSHQEYLDAILPGRKIEVSFEWFRPKHERYIATLDSYEPGKWVHGRMGFGPTEEAAREDLVLQIQDWCETPGNLYAYDSDGYNSEGKISFDRLRKRMQTI